MANKNTRLQVAAFTGGYFPIAISGTGVGSASGSSGYKWIGSTAMGAGFAGGIVTYRLPEGIVGQRIHAVNTATTFALHIAGPTVAGAAYNFVPGYDAHVGVYSSNKSVTSAADIETQNRVCLCSASGEHMIDYELPSGHTYLYVIFYSMGHCFETSTAHFGSTFYNQTLPALTGHCSLLIEEP
jgi:hypothetical protein